MTDIRQRLAPVIAHRGAAARAPENTLAAIRLAAEEGARWVEVDVKLSRDGHCILMHDELLGRTTNGRGEVAHHDLDELQTLDAGGWFAARHAGEPIPTLEAALELCLSLELDINLEIKPCPGREQVTAAACIEVVRATWPVGRPWPLLSSFATASLEEAFSRAPELPRGLLIERPAQRALAMLDRLECVSLHCDHKAVSTELVRALDAVGRPLLCYTVNEPARARLLREIGVASIITDRPAEIGAAIGFAR